MITISVLGLPVVTVDATMMGFCGGMSFLARDIFEAGTPQLRGRTTHLIPLPLAQLLLARLVQSFGGPGVISQWLSLTAMSDHDTVLGGPGLFHRTVEVWPAVTAEIDLGHLCPIGVVLAHSANPADVFNNHVELVYGYDNSGGVLTLHVYDCNHPGNDSITISFDNSTYTPAKVISTNGTSMPGAPGQIRGFFPLPYTHADPSAAYIDNATPASATVPPAMTPGQHVPVTVAFTNTGSTTWTPAAAYRLGSQGPQDSTTWGTGRVVLPGPVDPQMPGVFTFTVVAPSSPGVYAFEWQMLRELVHWFGPISGEQIRVGADTALCAQLHDQYQALQTRIDDLLAELAEMEQTDPVNARRLMPAIMRQVDGLKAQQATIVAQQQQNGCAPQ